MGIDEVSKPARCNSLADTMQEVAGNNCMVIIEKWGDKLARWIFDGTEESYMGKSVYSGYVSLWVCSECGAVHRTRHECRPMLTKCLKCGAAMNDEEKKGA